VINYNKLHADPKQGKNLDISTLLCTVFACDVQYILYVGDCISCDMLGTEVRFFNAQLMAD